MLSVTVACVILMGDTYSVHMNLGMLNVIGRCMWKLWRQQQQQQQQQQQVSICDKVHVPAWLQVSAPGKYNPVLWLTTPHSVFTECWLPQRRDAGPPWTFTHITRCILLEMASVYMGVSSRDGDYLPDDQTGKKTFKRIHSNKILKNKHLLYVLGYCLSRSLSMRSRSMRSRSIRSRSRSSRDMLISSNRIGPPAWRLYGPLGLTRLLVLLPGLIGWWRFAGCICSMCVSKPFSLGLEGPKQTASLTFTQCP